MFTLEYIYTNDIFLKLISECPKLEQVRFGENCYEAAFDDPQDIVSNVNECKHKGGDLLVPTTSAEHHFVAQTFQSSNGMYHLGVAKYKVK